MKNILSIIILLLFLGSGMETIAQKTVINNPPQKTYNDALQLFQQENYGSAAEMFDLVRKEINNPENAYSENAAYYRTVCAVNLGNKDALKKVKNFALAYPESSWIPTMNYELGKLYYSNKKYKDALKSFQQVRPGQLSRSQQSEYYYKKGFAQLSLGKDGAALKSFSKVKGTKSSYSAPARYYTAHIYYNKGDYKKALTAFKAIENDRRFKKHVPNYLIHIYYELGDYQKVIDEGTAFLKKADNKTKGEMSGLVANAYFNLGDYEQASVYFDMYERMVRKEISPAEHYRIGYTKFINEKYRAAIVNFQQASKGDESFSQNAWYHLGFCYLNTDQAKFAQSAFLKAHQLKGSKEINTDALYNYVKITIDLGSDPYNDPVGIVEKFIDQNPDLPRLDEAYDLLAQLYLTSRKYKAALASIEKNRNPNRNLQLIYQQIAWTQGIEYFNRGEYNEAINYFDKSLYYQPDPKLAAQTTYWFADALYRLKRFDEAGVKYNQFKRMGAAKQTDLYSNSTYNQAYAYFNQKQYSKAVSYFSQFLKQNNQNINLVNDAKLRLADSYFIMTDYTQAMRWYDQVLNGGVKDVDYAIYQKAFCYGAQSDFRKKISTLQRLVRDYKSSNLYDDALYEIASTNLILKDQRGAITYFNKLVTEKPNSSFSKKALVKMGFVYYNNNQYDHAIKTLKKVVDRYPASIEAKESLNTLQNIYMDMGQVDKYFAYAKGLDFVQISTSDQDSLTFTTGENYYIGNDCSNAIPAFEKYLQQFPTGGFVLSAYNYLSLCYEKQNTPQQAIIYYQKIIEFPDNQYTDKALLKMARYEFENKDYQMARQYYERLNLIAENKGMVLEARDGTMRSAYLLNDYKAAIQYAEQLINTEDALDAQVLFAHYILAKSSLKRNNTSVAETNFILTDELTSGEMGAEAKYELALINFHRSQLDEAENLIYALPDQYPDFDYWIAKAFILLSDIYVARDNDFQAEQTLLSIIENYPGEDLKEEARLKLEQIKPPESNVEEEQDEIEID